MRCRAGPASRWTASTSRSRPASCCAWTTRAARSFRSWASSAARAWPSSSFDPADAMTPPLLPDAPFEFRAGTAPLLVSMPHVGTTLPPCMQGRLSRACEPLGDTDWHLPRLYDFVQSLGASTLIARYTRFAVDLNRPPDDAPLYATATTGLHPDILFDGTPAFIDGRGLTRDERGAFLAEAWIPYHAKLGA